MKMERSYTQGLLLLVLSALALVSWPAHAQISLVSTGSIWKYVDNGSDQGTAWQAADFPDGDWLSGPAELGFGDGGEATTNTAGFVTYYYRQHFNVADASSITNLRARIKRDDGAVVYLNGTEVFRDNMPTGAVTYFTLAATTAADDGQNFWPHSFPASALVSGDNVLAVEMHQATTTSSDISFDMDLVGNPLPLIAITSPTNGQTIASATVAVSGTAVPGGTNVTLIEVSQGGNQIGTATAAAFSVAWQDVAPGNYTLVAKVTDSSGLQATSAPVNITVQAAPASLLVPRNSNWKYHNLNQDLGTAWLALNYDDSAGNGWAEATAPLGDNLEGSTQEITAFGGTVIDIGPSGSRYPTLYFRKKFTVSQASAYTALTLRVMRDDAAFIYLNGQFVTNVGCAGNSEPDLPSLPHTSYCCVGGAATGGTEEYTYFEYSVPTTFLVNGTNIFAVEGRNQAASSSDLAFDMEVEGAIDTVPPTIIAADPQQGAIVPDLSHVIVTFSEPVLGVSASDLLINSEPATNLLVISTVEFQFNFPTPPTGTVQITWAPNHGITDTSPLHNPFDGSVGWIYTYTTNFSKSSQVVISEFMTKNVTGIRDDDGQRNDWIELRNTDKDNPINLDGWYLTDDTNNLTQWRFPAVIMQPNSYMIVWASAKDRRDPNKPLHTNFQLKDNDPLNPPLDSLVLCDPNTNIVSAFLAYPQQQNDISYGRDTIDATVIGYYSTPTPGTQNSSSGSGFMSAPVFSIPSGVYTNNSLSLTLTNPSPSGTGTLRYTTDGSNPTSTSTIYSGPISITGNMTVKARVYPPGGTNALASQIIAGTYVLLDSSLWTFNSNLPLLVLDSHTTIPADIPPGGARAPGTFVVFDTIGGRATLLQRSQLQQPAGFELFGQTSISIWGANAKHPFNVEIQDDTGNDLELSFLGLPADADWKLRPAWEKSLMNDFLAFELFEQMGNYSLRRRYVEVFVHQGAGKLTSTDYGGIEVLLEKIEIAGNRTDLQKLTVTSTNEPDITGGYIFKKDKDSTGDLNFSTSGSTGVGAQALKFHDPKPRELTGPSGLAQQNYLRTYLNRMEQALGAGNYTTATGTNHYSYFMDVDAFVDQFWIVEFPKQIDGYRLSDYFSKDRNGKVRPIPIWDWNLSFGNANYLDCGHYANWYWNQTGGSDYPWSKKLITGNTANQTGIGDPDFNQKLADRWCVLRTNVMNGPRVLARITELTNYLWEAATRPAPMGDFTKPAFARLGIYQWPEPNGAAGGWDVNYQDDPTWPSVISDVKKWVNGRFLWIDSLFLPPPSFSQGGGEVTNGTTITLSVTPGATNFYTLDGTDPRAPQGALAAGALTYTGPITINANARIFVRSRMANAAIPTTQRPFQNTWSGPAVDTFYSSVSPLRITEIMYHPAGAGPGNTNDADNFEYIEVQNTGGTPLNVNRFSLGGGIQFDFPPVTLDPGQYGVIVANLAAFQLRYGTNNPNILVLGVYTGNLGNGGDHIVLSGPLKEPILDFSYSDNWQKATDGAGFSLVLLNAGASRDTWGVSSSWRASAAIGGSPGQPDPAPPARPGIVINEVLSNGDPAADAIELYNPTGGAVNIGGWFLTDDFDKPRKFVIPNTTILSGQYVTFTTNDFGAGINGFALSGKGDDVYLFSGDAVNITGYAHGFDFGAAEHNVTFGRYVITTGEDHFVPQKANTLGATNAGPLVGPIVISEIMYHPPDTLLGTNGTDNNIDEFIELQNITMSSVILFDPTRPTNTWHLRDAVDFDFPQSVAIGPTSAVIVVSFDPVAYPATLDAFRQRNLVPASVPVYGPWSGQLQNDNESVELRKPRSNDTNAEVPYVLVERVKYRDQAPWPVTADGIGLSLQRLVLSSYGNEPTNWAAAAPTPGRDNVFGGSLPTITSQPGDQLIVAGGDATFTAAATGTGPLRYQWTYYGRNLPGATNTSLVITNFQTNYAGIYNVRVFNSAGYGQGTNFTITSRVGLRFTGQPSDRTVVVTGTIGPTTNFAVSAVGSGLLRYQWYYNGNAMNSTNNPTATNATLTLTNIQFGNAGTYYATVRDDFDLLTSTVGNLSVVAPPAISFQPISVIVTEGATATFTISAVGSTPMSFRWRTNGVTYTSGILYNGGTYGMLTIPNTPLSYSNILVTAVITNVAGSSPVSSNARLTVLPDSDHDGLPDSWEDSHAGFDKNDPADGARDDDGDGMSNAAEYIAGTDYLNPNSYLKIQFAGSSSNNVLQFTAVTNRTYTVQYNDDLSTTNWRKLGDVVQRNLTRTESVTDPGPRTNRFYRLVIPIQR